MSRCNKCGKPLESPGQGREQYGIPFVMASGRTEVLPVCRRCFMAKDDRQTASPEVAEDVPLEPVEDVQLELVGGEPKARPAPAAPPKKPVRKPQKPPVPLRLQVRRYLEGVLTVKFLAPFGAVVLILAVVTMYVSRESEFSRAFRQGRNAMQAGDFSKAQEVFEGLALANPNHPLAPKAREEAKFCSIRQQAQSGVSDRQALVRLCESFVTDYKDSEHVASVKEVIQATLLDDATAILEEARKTRSAPRMQNAVPILEKAVAVNPAGQYASQAQALIATVQQESRRIQEEDAFNAAKGALLRKSKAWLDQRRFAALRSEIADITSGFAFAGGDADIKSLVSAIAQRELAASSFMPASGPPPAVEHRAPAEDPTFVLMHRRCESQANGVEGEVVFLPAKGRCLALDATSGAHRWSADVGSAAPILPVVMRDPGTKKPLRALISAPAKNTLRCVGLADGAVKWTYRSSAPFCIPPWVSRLLVYLPTLTDGIHVLDADTGRLEGKYWFDGEIRSAPVFDEERRVLYVLPENGCIYAVSLAGKACRQIVQGAFVPYALACSAVLVGDYLLVVEYQGLRKMQVKIFSRGEDGLNLRPVRTRRFDIGENVGCRPVVSAGCLYVLTERGMLKVYGVNVRDEELPVFDALEEKPFTYLSAEYELLVDPMTSPFYRGVGYPSAIIACGNGLAVYQFDTPKRVTAEVWRFPPGGPNPDAIPGEAVLPAQRIGNLISVCTTAAGRDGVVLSAIDLEQKALAWQVAAGAAAGAPVVDEGAGRIFVRDRRGLLYAFSPAEKGSTFLDRPFLTAKGRMDAPLPPAFCRPSGGGPGALYVAQEDNTLHAVNLQDGTPLPGWEEPFRTQAQIGPLVPYGKDALAFGTDQGGVFLVSLANSKRYCQEFADPGRYSCAAPPAVGPDGAIFVGNLRGSFLKLILEDRAGGRYLREDAIFKASAPIRAGAAVAGKAVFVGDEAGRLYALSAADLTRSGEWTLGAPVTSDLSAAGGIVLAGSETGCLHAVSLRQKTPLWRYPKEGSMAAVVGKPLTMGRYVVIGSADGKVHALNVESGEPVWTHDVGAGVSAGLALMDRRLVVPCADGSVRLVALPDRLK